MKRQIYKSLALLIIILISSCESYQIHGDLDGFWQVSTIENKETGAITYCNGDTYYSFQRDLVLISYVSPNIPTGQMKENYVAYFSHENDSIYMTDFRRSYVDKDEPVTLSKLEKFGLYDTFNNFQVEKLNKRILILNSNKTRITLQKY